MLFLIKNFMTPTREQVLMLVDKYSQATKQHLHQVGRIMEYFGQKLGQDSQYWWTIGILHDIDRDYIEKNGERHLKEDFDKICDEVNLTPEARGDIRSHGHFLP